MNGESAPPPAAPAPDETAAASTVPPVSTPAAPPPALYGFITPGVVVLIIIGSILAGITVAMGVFGLLNAWDVAKTVHLLAALALLCILAFCLIKVFGLIRRVGQPPPPDAARPAPGPSWLQTLAQSVSQLRGGARPLDTSAAQRLETSLAGARETCDRARASAGRLLRGLLIAFFCTGLLALGGIIIHTASLLLTQVQTRRLEEQNRLLVAQNTVTVRSQSFTQAQALAATEFEAAERVLLDLTSPLSLQEQKLRQLPDIAAMQVPMTELTTTTSDDGQPLSQTATDYITLPNAPRVRSLLLAYMKLDRVGHIRSKTPSASPPSREVTPAPPPPAAAVAPEPAKPTEPEDVPMPTEPASRVIELILDDCEDLRPLEGVSTALLEALHRMGPQAPAKEPEKPYTDAEVADMPSLWKLGETTAKVPRIASSEEPLYAPRKPLRLFAGSIIEPRKLNLRHLAPEAFIGLQVPFATHEGLVAEASFPDRAKFTKAQLQGMDLHQAQMHIAEFTDADLQHAKLAFSRLDGSLFRRCSLSGAEFHETHLTLAEFRDCRAHGIIFDFAQLHRTYLYDVDLSGATFLRANLTGASFRDCPLHGARFNQAILKGTTFSNVDCGPCTTVIRTGVSVRGATDDALEIKVPCAVFSNCEVGDWHVLVRNFESRSIFMPDINFDLDRVTAGFWGSTIWSYDRPDLVLIAIGLPHDPLASLKELLWFDSTDPTRGMVPFEFRERLLQEVGQVMFTEHWTETTMPPVVKVSGLGQSLMDAATKEALAESLEAMVAKCEAKLANGTEDEKSDVGKIMEDWNTALTEMMTVVTDAAKVEERLKWSLEAELEKLRKSPSRTGGARK